MRLPLDEKHAIEVIITGSKLQYDKDSGYILGGEVQSISLSSLTLNGRKFVVDETRKLGGLDIPAEKLADMAGDKFWNHIKLVVDLFDKFAQVHDAVTFSYFSPDKNVVYGTNANDKLMGSKYGDYLESHAGNDRLYGGTGDDSMDGGSGNDMLTGGSGNDLMIDLEGKNSFSGGTGDDRMRGGAGADRFTGSNGRDIMYGAGGTDTMSGGRNADVFVFNLKETTKLTISDFTAEDVLVNLATGNAEEGYKHFMQNAHQAGKDVIYVSDDFQLILKKVDLDRIGLHNFAEADLVKEAGLLF